MKCETIQDLLPLYIDNLTSEISNQEIESHLKKCNKCQQYYKEMTGELADILPKTEINSIEIIKKEGKKRKRIKKQIIAIITTLCIILSIVILISIPRTVKLQDVSLDYGINNNIAYVEVKLKTGGNMSFNGEMKSLKDENQNNLGSLFNLTVTSSWGILKDNEGCRLEANLENEEIAEWNFIFSDKIVTIKNGELVSIKDVK